MERGQRAPKKEIKREIEGEILLSTERGVGNNETAIFPIQILKIKDVIKDIQTIQIDNTNASKIKNGNIIPNKYNTNMCLFIDEQNNEIAIYQTTQDKLYLKPYKML